MYCVVNYHWAVMISIIEYRKCRMKLVLHSPDSLLGLAHHGLSGQYSVVAKGIKRVWRKQEDIINVMGWVL